MSPLIIDNNVVEKIETTKFLGVYIYQHLNCGKQIPIFSVIYEDCQVYRIDI